VDHKVPIISVIIVNYNGFSHLPKLINSLKSQDYSNLEIIFIDNGSNDQSVNYIKQNLPTAIVHTNDTNLGFAAANNQGLTLSKGDYLLFLNNDTYFDANLVSNLYRELLTTDANAVAPLILFSKKYVEISINTSNRILLLEHVKINGSIINNVIFPNTKIWKWVKGKKYLEFSEEIKLKVPILDLHTDLELDLIFLISSDTTITINNKEEHTISNQNSTLKISISPKTILKNKIQLINSNGLTIHKRTCTSKDINFGDNYIPQIGYNEVEGLSGCCFLIKKNILKKKDIFNPSYFAYYEDVDFFLRLNKKFGTNNLVCLNSILYHNVSSTFSKYQDEKIYLIERNRLLTVRNHTSTINWLSEWFIFFMYTIYMNLGGNPNYGAHRKHIHTRVCRDLISRRSIKSLSSIFTKQ